MRRSPGINSNRGEVLYSNNSAKRYDSREPSPFKPTSRLAEIAVNNMGNQKLGINNIGYSFDKYGNRLASKSVDPDSLNRRPIRNLASSFECKTKNQRPEDRSEAHTSELQSPRRTPYAAFCSKKTTFTSSLP